VSDSLIRLRASQAVHAIVSDDNNYERGAEAARAIADRVVAETGVAGLTALAVALSLKLADALERIAVEQEVAAVDLVEVWFVD
jgi:hypothetical protein